MHEPRETRSPQELVSGLQDRRLNPRVGDQIDVTIYAMGLPAPVEGRTRDIGPDGLCVETESPVGLDRARRLVLHLAESDPSLKVSCCWQGNAPGREGVLSGFRFVELEPAHTEALWEIVFRRARELASFLCSQSDLDEILFEDAVDLAMHSRLARFADGDWIYRQGSREAKCKSAYLVLRGQVSIEAVNENSESVYLDQVPAGGFFGGLPMLASTAQPETAMAETACELLEIDPFSFQYLLSDRPNAAYAITRALVGRYAQRLSSLIAGAPIRRRNPLHRFVARRASAVEDFDPRHSAFGCED